MIFLKSRNLVLSNLQKCGWKTSFCKPRVAQWIHRQLRAASWSKHWRNLRMLRGANDSEEKTPSLLWFYYDFNDNRAMTTRVMISFRFPFFQAPPRWHWATGLCQNLVCHHTKTKETALPPLDQNPLVGLKFNWIKFSCRQSLPSACFPRHCLLALYFNSYS